MAPDMTLQAVEPDSKVPFGTVPCLGKSWGPVCHKGLVEVSDLSAR